jgi:transposase
MVMAQTLLQLVSSIQMPINPENKTRLSRTRAWCKKNPKNITVEKVAVAIGIHKHEAYKMIAKLKDERLIILAKISRPRGRQLKGTTWYKIYEVIDSQEELR